jgi:hypothetical protein
MTERGKQGRFERKKRSPPPGKHPYDGSKSPKAYDGAEQQQKIRNTSKNLHVDHSIRT